MFETILNNLGLKPQEIKIFITSASLGSSPASLIAKRSSIKRTTCYQILEHLCDRSLIKKTIKSHIKYYEAISLLELKNLLNKQIQSLNETNDLIEKNVDELEGRYQKTINNTKVSFFEGYDDLKIAYTQILETKDNEILSFTKKDFNINTHPLKTFWDEYFKNRLRLKKTSYNIYSEENNSPININNKKLRLSIGVNSKELPLFGDVKVSGDKVMIVSHNKGRIFGILIENSDISSMFRGLHKFIWNKFI